MKTKIDKFVITHCWGARLTLGLVFALGLFGCSTNQKFEEISQSNFHQELIAYEASLPSDHPDRVSNMFVVKDEIKQAVAERFRRGNKHRRAHNLADWLVAADGHAMVYDLEANFTPNETFEQRRGNCLSFTILLVTLANELGIDLQYNDVDLPSMWDMDEDAGLIFYRHVNAVFESAVQKQIFDLAIEDYDAAYPQRTFPAKTAGALLHSNLGIQALKKNDFSNAFHHLKLAVSIDPEKSDLWINLGVAFKRHGQLQNAETAFRTGLKLNDRHGLAASNLEHLYREQGHTTLANRYEKLAAKARLKNPYEQYRMAQKHYKAEEFRLARKAIRRAIQLHDLDPNFFALSSAINQHYKRYIPALKDLEKAFTLTTDAEDKGRYYDKVKMVAKRAEQYAHEQRERHINKNRQIELIGHPPTF